MRIKNPGSVTSLLLILAVFAAALAGCGNLATPALVPAPVTTAVIAPGLSATATPTLPSSPTPGPVTTAAPSTTTPAKTAALPPTATASGSTPASATTVTPDTGAGSVLQTLDLSFISDSQGWALFSNCAGSNCKVAIKMTTGGGQTWLSRPAPPAAPGFFPSQSQGHTQVGRIHFANARDGWLFGPGFYSTHDGGASWQAGDFPGDVIEMASVDSKVLAVTRACPQTSDTTGCTYGLLSSSDSGQSWQKQAGFPAIPGPEAQLVPLSEQFFWLLSHGSPTGPGADSAPTLAVTRDGGKSWQAQANPCAKKGSVEARLAASGSQNLYLVCASMPGAGQQLKYLFTSGDGGQSWQETGTMAGTASGYLGSFAASGPGTLWLALTRYTLLTSGDGGLNWKAVFPIEKANPSNGAIGPVVFADKAHGWFAADQGRIFYTVDGGATWLPGAFK